jgi:predicted enzyme related to lactoylglutathione lyase
MSQAQAEKPQCEVSIYIPSIPVLEIDSTPFTCHKQYGDICWVEFPATDMKRCQTFYCAAFGWEFSKAPGMPESSEEPGYVLFTKPGTKLSGGIVRVKEEHMIRPKLDAEGCGETTNRITMRVEEVEAALKKIESAGGSIIW